MKLQELGQIQNQIHLHNNLKKWFRLSFIITAVAAMLVYCLPAFWMKITAGIVLALCVMILLVIGLGLWRSKKTLLEKLV